jgi:hypothetical protein
VAVLVEARGGNLTPIGPLTWSKVDIMARHLAVGSWTLTMPYTQRNWDLSRTADVGILVDWNGVWKFSGHAETWGHDRVITDGKLVETITLSGADDLAVIANRVAYPNPAAIWAAQTNGAADLQTAVKLETAIKHYVRVNAGPGALPARRAPHLTIAANLARGGTVSYTARFGDGIDLHLMDIIRLLTATGGPMGVSVTQVDGGLVFDTYVPRDLTDEICFATSLGSLRQISVTEASPTATSALVRGETTFAEVSGAGASNPWLRVEQLVDQSSSTDAIEMAQAGTDAIVQGAGQAQIQVSAIDLPRVRFGADGYGVQGYLPGDRVSVEVREGLTYEDIVSAVHLVAEGDTETVTPIVGAADADTGENDTATTRLAAQVRALTRQLKQLQS